MPMIFPDIKRIMMKYRNPDRAYKGKARILSVDTSAAVGVKTIQFQAVFKPETKGAKDNYSTTVRFSDVPFTADRRNTKHAELLQDGKTLYHPVPSVRRNAARMKCSCPDFRFSFEKQDYDAGILIGNWRRYKRKTPPDKRPPNARNPNPQGKDYVNAEPDGGDDVVGYCKHIHYLLQLLYKQGKVRN